MSLDDCMFVTMRQVAAARAQKTEPKEEIRLTESQAERIYVGQTNKNSECMKGSITTEDRCPVCGGVFELHPKFGLICREHLTCPEHLIITIYVPHSNGKSKKERIYCDQQGDTLDSFKRTERILEEINEAIKDGTFNIDTYRRSNRKNYMVSFLLPMFLEEKKAQAAPSYVDNYVHYCKLHDLFWHKWDVNKITQHDVNVVYLKWLRDHYKEIDRANGIKAGLDEDEIEYKDHEKTIQNVFYNFKTFHNWMIEKGTLPLAKQIRFSEITPPEPDLSPPFTQAQMYDMFHKYTPVTHRNIFKFLLLHSVRPGEARAIKMSKIELDENRILIDATYSDEVYRPKRKGKKSTAYYVNIHPESLEWITGRYENRESEDEHLFRRPSDDEHYASKTLEYVWDKIRTRMGLPEKMRLYDATRHTAATLLAKKGYDEKDISKVLGHAKPSTTKRYMGGVLPPPSKINTHLTLIKPSEDDTQDEKSGEVR